MDCMSIKKPLSRRQFLSTLLFGSAGLASIAIGIHAIRSPLQQRYYTQKTQVGTTSSYAYSITYPLLIAPIAAETCAWFETQLNLRIGSWLQEFKDELDKEQIIPTTPYFNLTYQDIILRDGWVSVMLLLTSRSGVSRPRQVITGLTMNLETGQVPTWQTIRSKIPLSDSQLHEYCFEELQYHLQKKGTPPDLDTLYAATIPNADNYRHWVFGESDINLIFSHSQFRYQKITLCHSYQYET